MTSIRKFVYAALLAVTTLSFAPSLAHAQEVARGQFSLPRAVRWQNAVVPAGDYRFSLESSGAAGMLYLRKLDGKPAGFMFLVPDTEPAKSSSVSKLILQSTPEGTYVSAMQLPELGMTLHFPVPPHTEEKMAKAGTASTLGQ